MVLLAKRIRNTFAFLGNKLLVVASEELIGQHDTTYEAVNKTWDEFLSIHQDKIMAESTESIIVLHGVCKPASSKVSKMEMIILNGTKIARIVFTDEESVPQWSDDGAADGTVPNERKSNILDEKLTLIHRIINGDKQKVKKPKKALFSFGPMTEPTED